MLCDGRFVTGRFVTGRFVGESVPGVGRAVSVLVKLFMCKLSSVIFVFGRTLPQT
jgi:hypothetical protein